MSDPAAKTDHQWKTDHQKYAWTRDQALTLLKKYEDQGWAVKQQMIAIFGLLTPVVFGPNRVLCEGLLPWQNLRDNHCRGLDRVLLVDFYGTFDLH
jgi:hypothetical protein